MKRYAWLPLSMMLILAAAVYSTAQSDNAINDGDWYFSADQMAPGVDPYLLMGEGGMANTSAASSLGPLDTYRVSATSTGGVITSPPRTGSGFKPVDGTWNVGVKAKFTPPTPGAWLALKLSDNGPQPVSPGTLTATITDTLSTSTATATGTVVTAKVGPFGIDYTWSLTATADDVPPATSTTAKAYIFDPLGFKMGPEGSGMVEQELLGAGTQVQNVPGSPAQPGPGVELLGRYGSGSYWSNGVEFWANTPPPGISDLFGITISVGPNDHIVALVNFANSNSNFGLQFSTTQEALASEIDNAHWVLKNGMWTLEQNISFDVDITSLNPSNDGKSFTIGTENSEEAEAAAGQAVTTVPEPGTLGLLGIGVVVLAGFARRRLNL